MNKLSRENSLKIATMSFIAAVLVVYIHVPHANSGVWTIRLENLVSYGLCSIAVPFFFAVSGYFLARHTCDPNWWANALKKRMRTILVPFLLWVTISTLIILPILIFSNYSANRPLCHNLSIFAPWTIYGLNPFQDPPTPYWYLRQLLIFVALSPVVSIVMSQGRKIAVLILCAVFALNATVCSLVQQSSDYWNFFEFFVCLRGLFYFSCGFYVCHYPVSLKYNRVIGCVLLVLSLGLMVLRYFSGYGIENRVVPEIATFMLLGGWWLLFPPVALPRVLDNMSFPIYVMHFLFIQTLVLPMKHLFPGFMQSFVGYLMSGMMAVSVCVLCVSGLRKWMPNLSSHLFGGR